MKVLIFVCGEGLGHTTRCLAAGSRLVDEGADVVYCAYGYSKKHLDDLGLRVLPIPSEIKLVGKSGSLSMRASIGKSLRDMDPLGYPRIVDTIRKEDADLVISDSYFLAALASKMLGRPIIFILNQTNMYNFFRNRGIDVALVGKVVKRFAEAVFKCVDYIVVPDFPPPYAICEKNIEMTGQLVDKMEFTGPLVRKRPEEVDALDLEKPHVFSMVGGFGYRERLFYNVIATAESMQDYHFTLVSGPNVDLEHMRAKVTKNVRIIKYLDDVFPYIKASDVIIAPGGHTTIMEAISFGKPLLSVPDMFHSEQQNNSEKVAELGIGMRLSYFTPPYMLEEFVKDSNKYAKNCSRMMKFSRKMDAPGRISEIAEELTGSK